MKYLHRLTERISQRTNV